jgi:hypothetical protein
MSVEAHARAKVSRHGMETDQRRNAGGILLVAVWLDFSPWAFGSVAFRQ